MKELETKVTIININTEGTNQYQAAEGYNATLVRHQLQVEKIQRDLENFDNSETPATGIRETWKILIIARHQLRAENFQTWKILDYLSTLNSSHSNLEIKCNNSSPLLSSLFYR